jgi:hypothetical protein
MGPAKSLTRLLRIQEKSVSAYGIKIAVAFLLSGVLHAATLPFHITGVNPLRYATFFWIQGICVLLEVFVEAVLLGSMKLKQKVWWRRYGTGILRLLWTAAILYLTVPILADELITLSRAMGLRPTVLIPLPKMPKIDPVLIRETIG